MRALVRKLNGYISWDLRAVETMLGVGQREAQNLVKPSKIPVWLDASAAPVRNLDDCAAGPAIRCRDCGEVDYEADSRRGLTHFLERVKSVNRDDHFLARVTRVIIFGNYLRPEVDKLGDVDVAAELAAKEPDRRCLRELNYRHLVHAEARCQRFFRIRPRSLTRAT